MKQKKYAVNIALFLLFSIISYFWLLNTSLLFLKDQSIYYCDQVIFSVLSKGWAKGIPLYSFYTDHKGPNVFLFFTLGYLLTGTDNANGILFIHSLWTGLSMFLVYRIVLYFKISKNTIFNHLNAILVAIGSIVFTWTLTLENGITVAQIVMPYALMCVLIYVYWYLNCNFISTTWLHGLYGISVMMIMLARASDAIFPFLLYVLTWLYYLYKVDDKKLIARKLEYTIGIGIIPYVIYSAYFIANGIFDKFMDCTFWGNFRYAGNGIQDENPGTPLQTVILLSICVVCLIIGYLRRNIAFKRLLIVAIPFAVHTLFVFMTPHSNYQYYQTFLVEILLLTFTIFNSFEFERGIAKNISCIIAAITIFACSIIGPTYVNWLGSIQANIQVTENEIVDDVLASGKSYMCLGCVNVLGLFMDKTDELPICKYSMFQAWHVKTHVITNEDLYKAIEDVKPEIIVELGISDFDEYLRRDYELVDEIDYCAYNYEYFDGEYTYYIYERIR